ncbi:uncharacterized protein BDV14DRAFT_177352 [Aspergillus stella-maris]|uniref:uncharacterized protein n=1 Tax=Aspergillus stella-maris TaxID=1810926 RepID=UPI003CCD3460
MRSNTIFLALSIITGVIAADEIVTMYIPDNEDGQALAGAVIGSNSDTTTYSVRCADSVTEECLLSTGATIIQAPSAVTLAAVEDGYTGVAECTYNSKIATCSIAVDDVWLATTTDPVVSYEVTITATSSASSKPLFGAESTSPTPTPTPTTMTTKTGAGANATATNSDGPSGAGAEETDTPGNGAMGRMSGMSGAAAAVALGVAVAVL